jgi:hypothetical protein
MCSREGDQAPHFAHSGGAASGGINVFNSENMIMAAQPAPVHQSRSVINAVPHYTHTAARKAAQKRHPPIQQRDTDKQEAELDDLVMNMKRRGKLSATAGRSTPAPTVSYVQRLPELQLSYKLAHAAELARRERANGYALTGGRRPSGTAAVSSARMNQLEALGRRGQHAQRW